VGIELARAYVRVGVDSTGVDQGFSDIVKQMDGVATTATIMGGIITGALGMATRSAVMAAGKFEQTMIAFSTMMGSASKASELLADLTQFAAETPFEMPEIENVARGLVMFGEDGKTLMETLKMLGNAASGTSSSFGMLGLVYNQIRGVGKLLTQDFRQLSTRGVISLRDIAKHYKVTDAAAQEMLSRGKISFEDFRKILMGLTGESGRFANMMEKQSKSMLGLLVRILHSWFFHSFRTS
jgi:tape measure domain-containing protein